MPQLAVYWSPTASEVAALIKVSTRQARRIGRALELSGYIDITVDGRMVLSDLVPADVIQTEAVFVFDDPLDSNGDYGRETPNKLVCGEYMPRANVECVLGYGHKGPHRSKT